MPSYRALAVLAGTLLLAGCGAVPSYYTDRMGASPETPASARITAEAESEPVRAAPKPRRAKRATPPAESEVAAAPAPAARTPRAGHENTGSAAGQPAQGNPAVYEPDATRVAQRERAITRSIGSICSGC